MRPGFDKRIHAPARLQLCASLAPLDEAEFQWLRERLGVSDSVLSKHLAQLEEAGFVRLVKHAVAGRRRTFASLTAAGRRAFEAHLAALQELVAAAESAPPAPPRSDAD